MNMEMTNMTANYSRFGRGGSILRARVGESIDDAQIIQRCPSVFADDKHESRSSKYTYLPTKDLLSGLRTEGFFPVEVRQGGSADMVKRGFTKHMIRLRRDVHSEIRKVGDSIPEVVLINSHDGTSSYQLFQGWFRLACLNGLVTADATKPSQGIKIGHRGDILGEVIEASYRVINESEETAHLIEDMTSTQLNDGERLAFANAAKQLRLNDDANVLDADIIRTRRSQDVGNDLWKVFNRAQENLVRGGIPYETQDANARRIHRRVREVKSIDGNVKLNQALWTLAQSMLALKQAA
jgi:hypothetical protein